MTGAAPHWPTMPREERLQRVTALTRQGWSAGMIAREFAGCSRNAIIGFWHRNPETRAVVAGRATLNAEAAQLRREAERERDRNRKRRPEGTTLPRTVTLKMDPASVRRRERRAAEKAGVQLPKPAKINREGNVVRLFPKVPILSEPVSILDRRTNQCGAIVSGRDPTGLPLCCGARVTFKSWCAGHAGIVYRPVEERRAT